ncbi:NAD(P)/FAD-dependent oxidoreductase [Bordetella petrii]|uniref:NAD(P)/FAD-dependent oxidoreductase n=1 Tax=Bordetella petrii TaxID=94624 RepID=UPI001A97C12E|nr:NAD(P)/FAD-dependent oxidoreductase [Bordetella petrii]MBO1114622.1 NAD(P)/FAD-dependent oxidoreductase [Bordetella petrii]
MHKIDCAVIGAGVVGLAIARELALAGREVVILEAEPAFGTQTSSRNSEVIHAGISYPAGSLKARLCVQGRHALYQYCAQRGIGHARIGKLIVATEGGDLAGLQGYVRRAREAGVDDLRVIDQSELARLEPAVMGLGAVHSPSTGIVDSHGLMLALLGDAENAGAMLIANSPVQGGAVMPDGIVLRLGGAQQTDVLCTTVVNSAGLGAARVAASLRGLTPGSVPRIHYARGRYYTMSGASPFRHLVYPVTREATMRVHVTLDLAGQCRFGPDLEWIDEVDYGFTDEREALFYAGIRRYYPGLPDGALQPGYTGIRPRLADPGAPLHSGAEDFRIEGVDRHGARGLVNLFGIESPGLTAALAIGQYVRGMAAPV